MTHLDHPSPGFPGWIVAFLLYLLPACFYVGDVLMGYNYFLGRIAIISFVGTKVLLNIFGTFDDDLQQHKLQLGHIMPISSGHDER